MNSLLITYFFNRRLHCLIFLCLLTVTVSAQSLKVDVFDRIEGSLSVAGGLIRLKVLNASNVDVTNLADVSFEYYHKPDCGGTITTSITYPFGSIKVTRINLSGLTEGLYYYRVKAVVGVAEGYSPWFRLAIVKKDNTPPVVTVPVSLIDTVRPENSRTLPELKLNVLYTDDCTDTVTVTWEKISGPAGTLLDDFKGTLTLKDVVEGTYVFQAVIKDDRDGVVRKEVKVIVNPPPPPPPLPSLGYMKAFSPNEDTIDDWWKVPGISAEPAVSEVVIINQFGQSVTSYKPPFINDEVWDGTQFGKPLPQGAYYFIIINKDKQEIKRGSVLLVR